MTFATEFKNFLQSFKLKSTFWYVVAVDVLYWVGCAGALDDANKPVSQSMVKILKEAGIKFAILGKEETCTGDAARRLGNEYLFQILAAQNIETFENKRQFII